MKSAIRQLLAATVCSVSGLLTGCAHTTAQAANSWNPKAAEAYLEQREVWWMAWPTAARDHDTFCVSCHTAVPYAFARPALRQALAEEGPSANERKLLDNVTKRVRLWKEIKPFYHSRNDYGHKADESRGTEAVLNALILASYDVQSGRLSDDTRAALDNMWALQQTTGDKRGAWSWLRFGLEPFEANDSQYYGATLAAVAVGITPENYRSSPQIQSNLKLLRDYLDREYASQSLMNRLGLLWASAKMPGLIEPERQKSIIGEVLGKQRSDGGWSLASLAATWSPRSLLKEWMRDDGTFQEAKSDGYATAFIAFALEQAGVPHENAQLSEGLGWLMHNQNPAEGFWPSDSINRKRVPTSNVGRFMSDAATAYAVLALTEKNGVQPSVAAK
jgi:squalene-hopene/tetraprenyl-beta-curcumene cyclase